MPEWQSATIRTLADAEEHALRTVKPAMQRIKDALEALKRKASEHRREILRSASVTGILLMLVVLWQLLREARAILWIRTRIDFLRYVKWKLPAPGPRGATQVYAAMERLLTLHDTPRPAATNTQEYLQIIRRNRSWLYDDAKALTRLFEDLRYGRSAGLHPRQRLSRLYQALYQKARI